MSDVSNFVTAMKQHPTAASELNAMTFWRYINGQFPKALRWMMSHPELLRALAADAEATLAADAEAAQQPADAA